MQDDLDVGQIFNSTIGDVLFDCDLVVAVLLWAFSNKQDFCIQRQVFQRWWSDFSRVPCISCRYDEY